VTDFVVDASVAIKWFVAEPESPSAERLLDFGGRLAAPRMLMNEIASGLWKNYFRNRISREIALASLTQAEKIIESWHVDAALLPAAMKLALDLPHHVYDCIYLVLARELGTCCVSADQKLLSIAPKGLAVSLSEWNPSVIPP
jgi:predicted nucleic acid-binding protein